MQQDIAAQMAAMERRLKLAEDQLAILQVLASYGPAVDSRSAAATAALWAPGGCYDFGDEPVRGAKAVGAIVDLDTHRGYVDRGCAHVMGLPMVTISGDRAIATSYSRVYLYDGDGWRVERASANRWELQRTPEGWRVTNRINRLMDGSPAGREILERGLADREGGGQ
ncbi:nuclear transport factor 2 family protein [Pontitalea aquivivens]|uniref:nuclear transport factor 2 family protein n=1 Tax=Pontitalea aquivivens TaxID=3388663 RepID=UPI0039705033